MISFRMSRPAQLVHGPRSGPLETSSHRRHHGAGHNEVPTPERTMSPVRHKNIALVGKAAIREHSGSGVARHAILATNTFNVRFLPFPSAVPPGADAR
jgi:hypothetical protein